MKMLRACLLLGVALGATPALAVYEGAPFILPLDFRDGSGAAVTPLTATYRIRTLGTAAKAGVDLVPATAIGGALASSMTVVVPAVTIPNRLLQQANVDYEESIECAVTVTFTFAAGGVGIGTTRVTLINVPGWPFP